MNKLETLALLRQHRTDFAEEKLFLAQTIDFVERNDHFWQRSTLEGHLTGSAWVQTARREAIEECGIQDLILHAPAIFDLDVHEIPARGNEPAHFHYDLRFLFFAGKEAEVARNLLETKAFAWVTIPELCGETTPQSIRRMALKTGKVERYSERF